MKSFSATVPHRRNDAKRGRYLLGNHYLHCTVNRHVYNIIILILPMRKMAFRTCGFSITIIASMCNEHICEVWDISASRGKPLPAPSLNMVSKNLIYLKLEYCPPLTANGNSNNHYIACHHVQWSECRMMHDVTIQPCISMVHGRSTTGGKQIASSISQWKQSRGNELQKYPFKASRFLSQIRHGTGCKWDRDRALQGHSVWMLGCTCKSQPLFVEEQVEGCHLGRE